MRADKTMNTDQYHDTDPCAFPEGPPAPSRAAAGSTNQTDNPFYQQYVFSKTDLMRRKPKLDLIDKIRLWFRPTYVQTSDEWAWHFKTLSDGRIFLLKATTYDESKQW